MLSHGLPMLAWFPKYTEVRAPGIPISAFYDDLSAFKIYLVDVGFFE